jgi:hypothetical protein
MRHQIDQYESNAGCSWYMKLTASIVIGVALAQIPTQILLAAGATESNILIVGLGTLVISGVLTWIVLSRIKMKPAPQNITNEKLDSVNRGKNKTNGLISQNDFPQSYKITIHLVSLLLPSFLLTLMIILNAGNSDVSILMNIARFVLGTLGFSVLLLIFYALAGGLEWETRKLSIIRMVSFWFFSGLIFGLIFYEFWLLIRYIMSKIYNIPFTTILGRLLVNITIFATDKTKDLSLFQKEYKMNKIRILGSIVGLILSFSILAFIPSQGSYFYRIIYTGGVTSDIKQVTGGDGLLTIIFLCLGLLYFEGWKKAESKGWKHFIYFIVIVFGFAQVLLFWLVGGILLL